MRKPAKKRAPQGATSLMVLHALVKLHTQGGQRLDVSRADLLRAVNLPETTVDDRLRTLKKLGKVWRVGRALYRPKPWPGQEPVRSEPVHPELFHSGKELARKVVLPDGNVVIEKLRWIQVR